MASHFLSASCGLHYDLWCQMFSPLSLRLFLNFISLIFLFSWAIFHFSTNFSQSCSLSIRKCNRMCSTFLFSSYPSVSSRSVSLCSLTLWLILWRLHLSFSFHPILFLGFLHLISIPFMFQIFFFSLAIGLGRLSEIRKSFRWRGQTSGNSSQHTNLSIFMIYINSRKSLPFLTIRLIESFVCCFLYQK